MRLFLISFSSLVIPSFEYSFLISVKISFTVCFPSQFFHINDPILLRFAVNVSSFLMILQKDLPKLLLNFGTFRLTRSFSLVCHSKSNCFGLNCKNSSTVGGRYFCLFFLSKEFPQRDIC